MTSRITPRFKNENTSNAAVSEVLGEYLFADLKYGRRVAERRKQRREEQHIARLKFVDNIINFAWDNIEDEEKIFAGIQMLKEAGVPMQKISFYVLTGFNTTFEQDIYRTQRLREAGVLCFVMQYKPTYQTRCLARWANKRWIYKSVPFAEYDPHYRGKA